LLKSLILWPACLVLALSPLLRAEAGPGDRIALLKFRMTGGSISFAGAQVLPGKLRMPRQRVPVAGRLQVELLDAGGSELAATVIEHPSRQRYEYVDSDGQLKSVTVVSDTADFYVRVPYSPGIARARFQEIQSVEAAGGAAKVATRPLGTVEVLVEADRE
jgi:hypothetical protein